MIEKALNTNRDGIGLIRTETLFYTREKLEKYRLLFLSNDYDIDDDDSLKKLLENFKQEQQSFLETIFSHMKDDFITVRLFDFRLQDVLRYSKKTMDELEREYFLDIPESRGEKYFEYRHSKLLKAQIEAILEACCKTGRKINILVPYIDSPDSLNYIKEMIANINVSYHIDYRFGAMIENTSSVSQCDRISKQVDFISFGLNDLTESVTQKSRNTGDNDFFYLNEDVKYLITEAIYRAKVGNNNIVIGACGEHTNYIENLEFLNSVGMQYISVSPSIIPLLQDRLNEIEHGRTLKREFDFD